MIYLVDLAEIAYNTYVKQVRLIIDAGELNIKPGSKLPAFSQLPSNVTDSWIAVAKAIHDELLGADA